MRTTADCLPERRCGRSGQAEGFNFSLPDSAAKEALTESPSPKGRGDRLAFLRLLADESCTGPGTAPPEA